MRIMKIPVVVAVVVVSAVEVMIYPSSLLKIQKESS